MSPVGRESGEVLNTIEIGWLWGEVDGKESILDGMSATVIAIDYMSI
jgi:hypothetical protein